MNAPLAWLREAYERRDQLAREGLPITLVPSVWGVSVWAEGVETTGRAWSLLEHASTNPLIPTIETTAMKLKARKALAA